MPLNLQEVNFEDLVARYYEGKRAGEIAIFLRREIEARKHLQLANLLRDHCDRAIISLHEIEQRAAVDDLLIFYDVLEIAILTGFIAPPDQSDFWKLTKIILENPQIRKFYTTFYPISLPQLLLARLEGRHAIIEKGTSALTGRVLQFLEQDQRFMATLNDSPLLRMFEVPPTEWTRGGEHEKEKPPCPRKPNRTARPTTLSSRNKPCSWSSPAAGR